MIIILEDLKEQRLGEISSNKFGTPMKIIDYKNSANVTVEFQDEFKYEITTTYNNFKRKVIKNPYDKTVCGVGYVGEGNYLTKRNHRPTVQYTDWSHIIIRCYKEKERKLHPAYENCTVCNEWLNFQTFAKWYDKNFYDIGHGRMHIDKDILHKGNKVYNLYVHPQYRHCGHSKRLLELVIGEIRKGGYNGEIFVQAKPKENSIDLNSLIEYYQHMGLTVFEGQSPRGEKQ